MDTHYFLMSSMAFFICILFDVIAFNMLKVLHIFCSVSSVCSFPVASAASWGWQGPAGHQQHLHNAAVLCLPFQ